jgi:hypothetical protein
LIEAEQIVLAVELKVLQHILRRLLLYYDSD